MKKQTLLLIVLAAAFVLLMVGAYALYGIVGNYTDADQLGVNDGLTEDIGDAVLSDETEAVDYTAPDFTVYDIDGNAYKLSDFFGTPIVLNFWASWCGPCKNEMPHFNEAAAEYDGKVRFLMVNMTDNSRETVKTASDFIASKGYSFPVFYDTDMDAAITYVVYSLPTTYFIDSSGNLITQARGAINDAALERGIDMIYPVSVLEGSNKNGN